MKLKIFIFLLAVFCFIMSDETQIYTCNNVDKSIKYQEQNNIIKYIEKEKDVTYTNGDYTLLCQIHNDFHKKARHQYYELTIDADSHEEFGRFEDYSDCDQMLRTIDTYILSGNSESVVYKFRESMKNKLWFIILLIFVGCSILFSGRRKEEPENVNNNEEE